MLAGSKLCEGGSIGETSDAAFSDALRQHVPPRPAGRHVPSSSNGKVVGSGKGGAVVVPWTEGEHQVAPNQAGLLATGALLLVRWRYLNECLSGYETRGMHALVNMWMVLGLAGAAGQLVSMLSRCVKAWHRGTLATWLEQWVLML